MTKVLITAYEPYDDWKANTSWLVLKELLKDLPSKPEVTSRLYPVSFSEVKKRLAEDLQANYDFAIHLGQAPGYSRITLEAVGINVAREHGLAEAEVMPLIPDGPTAYQTSLPLAEWTAALREQSLPTKMSFHAGTYLCNAALYLSHYYAESLSLKTRSLFVHLPIETSHAITEHRDIPTIPIEFSVHALRWILSQMEEGFLG